MGRASTFHRNRGETPSDSYNIGDGSSDRGSRNSRHGHGGRHNGQGEDEDEDEDGSGAGRASSGRAPSSNSRHDDSRRPNGAKVSIVLRCAALGRTNISH
jgi:hypothetical protein